MDRAYWGYRKQNYYFLKLCWIFNGPWKFLNNPHKMLTYPLFLQKVASVEPHRLIISTCQSPTVAVVQLFHHASLADFSCCYLNAKSFTLVIILLYPDLLLPWLETRKTKTLNQFKKKQGNMQNRFWLVWQGGENIGDQKEELGAR